MKLSSRPVFVALIALLLLATAVPSFASQVQNNLRGQLEEGAKQAGVEIQTEQMFSVVREGVTFAAAVTAGYENVGAVNLPNGVDFGFAYLDAPTSGIPTGFYTLRATGQNPQLGENEVRVDLVDNRGEVVRSLSGIADVTSLDVPANPPAPRTVVGGGLNTTDDFRIIWISGWYFCPNGMVICFDIIIFDDFSHF